MSIFTRFFDIDLFVNDISWLLKIVRCASVHLKIRGRGLYIRKGDLKCVKHSHRKS